MVAPKFRATSIPACVGGLNDRESIADMPPTDAVVLDNWWPYPSYLGVRKGSQTHVSGFSAPVETLVEYLPTTGVSTLFAVSGGSIYDVTAAGAVGAAAVSGLTNSRFQNTNITTPGGSFLYLVNGEDKPQLFNGSAWIAVDGASTPAITGVTTTELVHVTTFKNRLFFVRKNSMLLYYLPVLSIGGAVSTIDLGSVFRLGGSIMAAIPWTIDAGAGADDHLAVISTNGEVAVYQGSDPSSISDWSLVGVFVLGKPIGRRCAIKFGGDVAVNTTEGVFPLAKSLLSASVDRRTALTDKIQNTVSQASALTFSEFGWDLALYPDANMLILNVPGQYGTKYQLALNTLTGAWTKFTGWTAYTWLNAFSGLYYGSDTKVYKAWVNDTDDGASIEADCLPAFSYFGSKAMNKYFTMVKPYIVTTGFPSILYSLNTDFNPRDAEGTLNFTPSSGMVWGSSMVWGNMVWGGSRNSIAAWNTVGAVAGSAAIRLRVQNNGVEVRFNACDYLYEPGRSVL